MVRCRPEQAELDDLHALLGGELRALVLAPYLTWEICASVAAGFGHPSTSAYDGAERYGSALYESAPYGSAPYGSAPYGSAPYGSAAPLYGPTLAEHRVNGQLSDRYWERAADAMLVDDAVPEVRDLRDCCRARLAGVFATSVAPATTVDGRELYWGVLRETHTGTPVHRNDVAEEFPAGILGGPVLGQLAFDLVLSDVPHGGETRIWASGADAPPPDGAGSVDVSPAKHAALIFDPRGYHRVLPCAGGVGRLSLSFFIGVTQDERLVIWS
ncbi:hypothetical protein GCM10009609_74250 [Pseudonocardia aurantiaca]